MSMCNEQGKDANTASERAGLQGWIPELAAENEIREALEQAFDYRGDVTITRKDGAVIEGYIFDRRSATNLADSVSESFRRIRTSASRFPTQISQL